MLKSAGIGFKERALLSSSFCSVLKIFGTHSGLGIVLAELQYKGGVDGNDLPLSAMESLHWIKEHLLIAGDN